MEDDPQPGFKYFHHNQIGFHMPLYKILRSNFAWVPHFRILSRKSALLQRALNGVAPDVGSKYVYAKVWTGIIVVLSLFLDFFYFCCTTEHQRHHH